MNLRDFREEWLPLAGDIMIGVSQTTLRGKTVDFEYLRLEPRPEGVLYIAMRYVEGRDLGQILEQEGPLGLGRTAGPRADQH